MDQYPWIRPPGEYHSTSSYLKSPNKKDVGFSHTTSWHGEYQPLYWDQEGVNVNHLGSRIRATRKRIGLTQSVLAEKVGVDRSHISK
ncbi:helix-turn-helix domain-containing protein [Candidatus Desulforudis audaxviator]|uniref:helix-turn-helix domain-containing protein n=1 Tax=Candidatus Desulforudis audaxviator TaxID=471827 RepID=UPI003A5BCC00